MGTPLAFAAVLRKYTCKQCGKVVEIPYGYADDYGYFSMGKRFCRYNCMRAYEREHTVNKGEPPRQYSERNHQSKMKTFEKMKNYLAYRKEGMHVAPAYEKAGFPSHSAMNRAMSHYLHTDEFKNWMAEQTA